MYIDELLTKFHNFSEIFFVPSQTCFCSLRYFWEPKTEVILSGIGSDPRQPCVFGAPAGGGGVFHGARDAAGPRGREEGADKGGNVFPHQRVRLSPAISGSKPR